MFKTINFKKIIHLIFGLVFFFAAIKYILIDFKLSDSLNNLKTYSNIIVIAYLFFLFHILLNFYRWVFIIKFFNKNIKLADCIDPFFISVGINYISPIKLGDAYRVFKNNNILKLQKKTLFSCIIVERLIDVLFLIGLLLIGLIIFFSGKILENKLFSILITIFFSSLSLGTFYVLCKYKNLLSNKIIFFNDILKIIFNERFYSVILITILSWICELVCFYVLFKFILNDISLSKILITHSGSILSIILPSGPGLIGPVDYTIFGFLNYFSFGVDTIYFFIFVFHFYILFTFSLIFLGWLLKLIIPIFKR